MKNLVKMFMISGLALGAASEIYADDVVSYFSKEINKMLEDEDAFPEDSLQRQELIIFNKKLMKVLKAQEGSVGPNRLPMEYQTERVPSTPKTKPRYQSTNPVVPGPQPRIAHLHQFHGELDQEKAQVMQLKQELDQQLQDVLAQKADIDHYQQTREMGGDMSGLRIQNRQDYIKASDHYKQSLDEYKAFAEKYRQTLQQYNMRHKSYMDMYHAYNR